jgi:putative flippase GtrA
VNADAVKQFLRFAIVGGGATLTHISTLVSLVELAGFPPVLANAMAFLTAVGLSFFGHCYWTFRPQASHPAPCPPRKVMFAKFVSVGIVGLGLNSLIAYIVVEMLSASYVYALVLVVTAVPVLLFFLSKCWVFHVK